MKQTMAIALSPHYKSVSEKTSSSETHRSMQLVIVGVQPDTCATSSQYQKTRVQACTHTTSTPYRKSRTWPDSPLPLGTGNLIKRRLLDAKISHTEYLELNPRTQPGSIAPFDWSRNTRTYVSIPLGSENLGWNLTQASLPPDNENLIATTLMPPFPGKRLPFPRNRKPRSQPVHASLPFETENLGRNMRPIASISKTYIQPGTYVHSPSRQINLGRNSAKSSSPLDFENLRRKLVHASFPFEIENIGGNMPHAALPLETEKLGRNLVHVSIHLETEFKVVTRNQGRKVISIGYVDNRCETSPPELPFFARCLCLNITVFSCTLTGVNFFSCNGGFPGGGGHKQDLAPTQKHRGNRCSVETNKYSVAAKAFAIDKNDTIKVQVNGIFVASCNPQNNTAEMRKPELKDLFGISITPTSPPAQDDDQQASIRLTMLNKEDETVPKTNGLVISNVNAPNAVEVLSNGTALVKVEDVSDGNALGEVEDVSDGNAHSEVEDVSDGNALGKVEDVSDDNAHSACVDELNGDADSADPDETH
ncbi:hypothetical protein MAR_002704 [Mya arenaria]|uniref:Uncharacterized protein n=1 Tax=Mya arenaria TaxID=6604 RepID=A0ABY7G7V8_MYAAR|nr:hypothetical protein MAR_002704 [Mya arenaria]